MSGGRKAVKVKRVLMFPKPYVSWKSGKSGKSGKDFSH